MNSLDPSLAKYLSSSKQEIYNAYHGTGTGTGTSTLSSDYAADEPARKKKKKKRKLDPAAESSAGAGTGTGMIIADEDGGYNPWTAVSRRAGGDEEDDDDESGFAPVVQHRTSAAFKPVPQPAIPQSAQEESIPADEAPLVIGGVVDEAPTASSSASAGPSAFAPKRLQGGLQTAAQLREESQRRRAAMEAEKEATRAKAAAAAAARGSDGDGDGAEETVYRDKSGRRIDAKAEKAEQKRRQRAELEKEIAKMEWGKGIVQREEKERRQRELEEMAAKPMARYADDADMNDEMRDVQRWNDPAARFLTESSKDKSKGKNRAPARPRYMGPAPPPNRFGILPGYRWDGVDRSNGFEKEYFQAGNKRKVQEAASRVYSTEDM